MFCKSDLYLVALLWKMMCNLGDPMSLRHPVGALIFCSHTYSHIFTYISLCIYICIPIYTYMSTPPDTGDNHFLIFFFFCLIHIDTYHYMYIYVWVYHYKFMYLYIYMYMQVLATINFCSALPRYKPPQVSSLLNVISI